MAIDLYSDTSTTGGTTTASPRISFSYDLTQSDTVPVEQLLRSFSSSSVDFNFIVNNHVDHHHADELFYDGKLVPTEIKKKEISKRAVLSLGPARPETATSRLAAEVVEPPESTNKSFWGFKRSSSCGSGYGRSLCPITLLSRSHSTGSSTSSKRSSSSSSKDGLTSKQNKSCQKPVVSQKPPLRKSGFGSYGNNCNGTTSNGIRVNPVLNLGFGSFFSSNNKNKNKK